MQCLVSPALASSGLHPPKLRPKACSLFHMHPFHSPLHGSEAAVRKYHFIFGRICRVPNSCMHGSTSDNVHINTTCVGRAGWRCSCCQGEGWPSMRLRRGRTIAVTTPWQPAPRHSLSSICELCWDGPSGKATSCLAPPSCSTSWYDCDCTNSVSSCLSCIHLNAVHVLVHRNQDKIACLHCSTVHKLGSD